MGNGVSSNHSHPSRKLIFWDGTTRSVTGKRRMARCIMAEFPDHLVCHADSFYIGRPIPALAVGAQLLPGETYFVLPVDRFPRGSVLSVSSLAAFRAKCPKECPIDFSVSPFEYLKGVAEDGGVLIKVLPEFIARLVLSNGDGKSGTSGARLAGNCPLPRSVCSTPELQKHYDQLVGWAKGQEWSPKLETVPEINDKCRNSPCMGLMKKPAKTRRVKFL